MWKRILLSAITGVFLPDLICRWAVEYGSFHCPSNQARITGVLQGDLYNSPSAALHTIVFPYGAQLSDRKMG